MDDVTKKRAEAAQHAVAEYGENIIGEFQAITSALGDLDPDIYLRKVAVQPLPDQIVLFLHGVLVGRLRACCKSDEDFVEYVRRTLAVLPTNTFANSG